MNEINITQQLNKKIAAILEFAGKTDIRYYLNGVCFEQTNGTLRAVATNGYFAAVAILETGRAGSDWQAIMPRAVVANMVKFKTIYFLDFEPATPCNVARFEINQDGIKSSIPAIDGKFPEWRRVMRTPDEPPGPAFYNVEYLATVAKASKIVGMKGNFNFTQYGERSGVFTIADLITGVIMPMKNEPASSAVFNTITGA